MRRALLSDIELDMEQLKCLLKAVSNDYNPTLCEAAKRNIIQLKSRLDAVYGALEVLSETQNNIECETAMQSDIDDEDESISRHLVSESKQEKESEIEPKIISVFDRTLAGLRHFLSLNDTFRFSRELFDGNSEKMNQTINELDKMCSLEDALAYFDTIISLEEENEAVIDFIEIIRRRYNN